MHCGESRQGSGRCHRAELSERGSLHVSPRHACSPFVVRIHNQLNSEHLPMLINRLADGPAYTETTDLLSELAPEEILLNGMSCQGNSRSLLCRKIEKWRDGFAGHPDIRPVRWGFIICLNLTAEHQQRKSGASLSPLSYCVITCPSSRALVHAHTFTPRVSLLTLRVFLSPHHPAAPTSTKIAAPSSCGGSQ
jgi:hypothetical protein